VTGPERNGADAVAAIDAVDRAERYLFRIVALTGATRVGPYCYVLDIGKTRFEVHDSYVCRMATPAATTRGTCFYLPNQQLPTAEKIASALLQLKSNPTLFKKWAGRDGVFKPDGKLFGR
jgi:hypothetical protein